jgi:8-oxo-dGTP diphosphatase
MITCKFEDGGDAALRHAAADALAVNDQGQVLLTKRSLTISRPGKYALPGGYVDRDEDVYSAVIRELREETGYIGKVEYLFTINDNTNFESRKDDRQVIAMTFVVKILSGDKMPNEEVSEIRWFDEANVPGEEDFAFDHRSIIMKYFEHTRSPLKLPLFSKEILS